MSRNLLKAAARKFGVHLAVGPKVPAPQEVPLMELAVRALFPTDAPIYCIQIGANDCSSNDPFIPLLKPTWRAILVEPQPGPAARLRKSYADWDNVAIEESIVATEPGETKLYYVANVDDRNPSLEGVASLYREHVLKFVGGDSSRVAEISVPALTFEQLIAKHEFPKLDILAIDAEGYDFKIIQMVDLASLKPAIVYFELVNMPYEEQEAALRHLTDHGYRLSRVGVDLLAVRTDQFTTA